MVTSIASDPATTIDSLSHTADELTIRWADEQTSHLSALWLRDHCQMPASRNPNNGQRLLNITDIPLTLSIATATRVGNDRLTVVFEPGGYASTYDTCWIRGNCYTLNNAYDDRSAKHKRLWKKNDLASDLPTVAYPQFAHDLDDETRALRYVAEYGFCVLTDVPCNSRQVLNIIAHFGHPRITNYGDIFEVKTVVDPNNLAYSNLGLGCHTDNPYRNPIPTVQLLHCLSNSTHGGDSILVDGFRAATVLREESPTHFQLLVGNWVSFRFSDDTADLRSRGPMIEVDDLSNIIAVRFNNRSISSIQLPHERMAAYYEAYRHFAEILEREDLKVTFKLEPGHLLLFDNTRVLHARTAFSSDGKRHLQGAYADLDSLYSRLLVLERSKVGV